MAWTLRALQDCLGLHNKTEQEQVGNLLHAIGECADDIVTTLRVNEQTASHTDVGAALNGYFAVRRNTIVERARFNSRKQTPEESVDTFIQDLYRIAEDCEYGTLKSSTTHYQIAYKQNQTSHSRLPFA